MRNSSAHHERWWIFWIMTLATVFSYFHQVSLATISNAVESSLNTGPSGIGTLAAAFSISYAFMQIPAGILSDTIGSRISVTVALLVASCGTLLFSLATDLHTGIVARIIIGAGIAVIAVPLMKLTAVWFPKDMFSKLTSLSFVVGSMGLLLATSPMAYLCTIVGWKKAYMYLTVLTAFYAALIWIFVRDNTTPTHTKNGVKRHLALLKRAMPHLFASKQLWIIGLWFLFQGGCYYAFIGLWSGQLLTKVLGVSSESMSLILILPVCGLMSAPLLTFVAEVCGSKSAVLRALSFSSVLLTLPLAVGLPAMHPLAYVVYLLLYAIATMGGTALVYAVAKDQFSTRYTGIVTGFVNIFPFVGCSLMHQIIGSVINQQLSAGQNIASAYSTAFVTLLLAAVCGAALSLMLTGARSRHNNLVTIKH